MRGYGDYCPIAKAAEVLSTRWTPIIVRNLILGCRTFNEIREGTHGIPRSILSERLRLLERYGIVHRLPRPAGRGWTYALTEAGLELRPVMDAMGHWGARWIEAAPEDADPYLALWSMCRAIDAERIPRRIVMRFDFRDEPDRPFWVLVQRPRPEVCVKHPGLEVELVVTTETRWLAGWQMGRMGLGQAMRERLIVFDGPPTLVLAFSRWGGVSPFAATPPAGGTAAYESPVKALMRVGSTPWCVGADPAHRGPDVPRRLGRREPGDVARHPCWRRRSPTGSWAARSMAGMPLAIRP